MICLTRSQWAVDLTMAILALGVAIVFGVLAGRHFSAQRHWRGSAMIAGAVASGTIGALWLVCTWIGVPPFFMGVTGFPPYAPRHERSVVRRLFPTSPFALPRGTEGESGSAPQKGRVSIASKARTADRVGRDTPNGQHGC